MMKTCSKCRLQKPRSEFYQNRTQIGGLAYYCKQCAKDTMRAIYANNPEKYRLKTIAYRAKHGPIQSVKRKANRREIYISECARRYNATKDVIRGMLALSGCEICGRAVSFISQNIHERPNIDHCHRTNSVRGLLCGYCNNLLGRAFDNPQTLIKAAQYLDERGY